MAVSRLFRCVKTAVSCLEEIEKGIENYRKGCKQVNVVNNFENPIFLSEKKGLIDAAIRLILSDTATET